ncbi:hypothetical protein EBR43_04880 [bacterium]|nr:hypothetical protein [bacterium]
MSNKKDKLVTDYYESKKLLEQAVSDAHNATFDFGYMVGVSDYKANLVAWIKENTMISINHTAVDLKKLLNFIESDNE